MVRSQSKMVQRPFSENNDKWRNITASQYNMKKVLFPEFTATKTMIHHKNQRPKISTIFSSLETGRGKTAFARMKIDKKDYRNDNRPARDTPANITTAQAIKPNYLFEGNSQFNTVNSSLEDETIEVLNQIPYSNFFPPSAKHSEQIDNAVQIDTSDIPKKGEIENIGFQGKSVLSSEVDKKTIESERNIKLINNVDEMNADFLIEETPSPPHTTIFSYNASIAPYICSNIRQADASIDVQEKYNKLDIKPSWAPTTRYWNKAYESRYESLMRNPKWPSLTVILVPMSHVNSIWKKSFEAYHNETVRKIITNIVKKLQFYPNLTFSWNEVSHLSYWWKTATQKSRVSLRRLLRERKLEVTTGGWVETDEATSNLFGILHQFIEGHQWLHHILNYKPKLGWFTSSVTHSPTIAYILSALSINKVVFTNIHYALEDDFAEYQYSDFVWTQSWDNDRTVETQLNQELKKIGSEKYPKHAVLTHYLQFNSDDFRACGPQYNICSKDYDFALKNIDVNNYNVKEKSEILLEQYSKTGTITPHNIIIAPLGAAYRYDTQTEFDYQYNNYLRIADFINVNQEIYKATAKFGVPSDYFKVLMENHKEYPTLKGDFLNFAEIFKGTPAYWTGYFTNRPLLKILLRRLEGTVRSTEVLLSFSTSYDSYKIYNESDLIKKIINVRETLARLQDRNVVSGTLSANTMKYVQNQILMATKECWYIQEVVASLLSGKPGKNVKYLLKYINRQGEFISSFKSIMPEDQMYIFNSLSHEQTEVIEIVSRNPHLRVIDHNKKDITIQIEPKWSYTGDKLIKISRQFFKIIFIVTIPPMTIELFKIKETYDTTHFASTIFCGGCVTDDYTGGFTFPFNIQPMKSGDVQLENYKHRLIFDEFTGLLKMVIEKESNNEKHIIVDYGAFLSSNSQSGMFLFKTNSTKPIQDILMPYRVGLKTKTVLIISGLISTEFISIYGNLLQHSVKIYNVLDNFLASVIKVESKVDYEVSPKHREFEIFMSVQTIIGNGNPPEIFVDNNGFEYTSRQLNISRPIESNMYPMTSMAFIQDSKSRLTIITDHAQGVTAMQEGQLVIMLDRRVLFNDGRGVNEGLADSCVTVHTNYILLENFKTSGHLDSEASTPIVELPSLLANRLANSLNYPFDIFFVDKDSLDLCYYVFLPLIKTSFPCDISVINLRLLLNQKYPKRTVNTALMILHRQSFSCRIDYSSLLRCSGERNFDIRKLFRDVKSAIHTNLAGTSEGLPVTHINHANLPAMELMSLLIKF